MPIDPRKRDFAVLLELVFKVLRNHDLHLLVQICAMVLEVAAVPDVFQKLFLGVELVVFFTQFLKFSEHTCEDV